MSDVSKPVPPPLPKESLLEHLRAVRDWARELSQSAGALSSQCQQLLDRIDPPETMPQKPKP